MSDFFMHEEHPDRPRTTEFRWQTREAFFDFFTRMYGLTVDALEAEVEMASEDFRLRRNAPIDTRELWQKVGLSIERRLSRPGTDTQIISLEDVDLQDMEKRTL